MSSIEFIRAEIGLAECVAPTDGAERTPGRILDYSKQLIRIQFSRCGGHPP